MAKISIITPVLNEEKPLPLLLNELANWCREGDQIIVVDGGSSDGSVSTAEDMGSVVISAKKGRARQMNKGASLAHGDILWFLHADSRIQKVRRDEFDLALKAEADWGHFDVTISGKKKIYRVIESFMNFRSRLSGIATGDMGIFVAADFFRSIGGFPEINLMEDIELCKRLKHGKSLVFSKRLLVSERRWKNGGVCKTVCLMWALRIAWFFGISDQALSRIYDREK